MPSAKKVAWSQLRVGIMVVVAMGILGVLLFLFTGTGRLWTRTATLHTYLDDSAALAVGAPVRLNGIVVGDVKGVALSGSKEPRRIIRIDMSVRREALTTIPVDSTVEITAENVLGTKYLNIRMGVSNETVQEGATLEALDTTEYPEVVQSGYNVLVSLRAILQRVEAIVEQVESGQGSIGRFLKDEEFYNRLTATITEFQNLVAAVGSGEGTMGMLLKDETLYEQLRASTQSLQAVLEEVQAGQGTAGKLIKDPALYDDAREMVAGMRRLVDDLNAGKGTAGKLLRDEGVHNQLSATLAKLDTMLEKVNTGQGTLGQLLVNPQMYESLNGASSELQGLMRDFRANPKKFLRIKLALF